MDVLEMIERAHCVVSELCSGKRRWSMSIPARPDEDPDIVISRTLAEARATIAALREENARKDEALKRIIARAKKPGKVDATDAVYCFMEAAKALSEEAVNAALAAQAPEAKAIPQPSLEDKPLSPNPPGSPDSCRFAWLCMMREPSPEAKGESREAERELRDAAWAECRAEREPITGSDEWTVGEVGDYRGFFNLGWEAALALLARKPAEEAKP